MVLQNPWRFRPWVRLLILLVPDIPFVKRKTHRLVGTLNRLNIIASCNGSLYKLIHIVKRSQKFIIIAKILKVAVNAYVVCKIISMLKNNPVPLRVSRHPRRSTSANNRLYALVRPLHQLNSLACLFTVIVSGKMANLPRPVHLVANAPGLNSVRLIMTVFPPKVAPISAAFKIAVLNKVSRILNTAGSHVHGRHKLCPRFLAPVVKLVNTNLIRLNRMPCAVKPPWPLLLWPNAILPIVARKKIPARIAHQRNLQIAHHVYNVFPKPLPVRQRMPRLINPIVNRPPQMLHKRAEQVLVHLANPKILANYYLRLHNLLQSP